MGVCSYCGKSAGWFRQAHEACVQEHLDAVAKQEADERKRQEALSEWVKTLTANVCDGVPTVELHDMVEEAVQSGVLKPAERTKVLAGVWSDALDAFLEDGVLSVEEEDRMTKVMRAWLLSASDLESSGAFWRASKASVLRDVMAGRPSFLEGTGVPVNMTSDEGVVWVFPDVEYLEDVVTRATVGGSQGVSFRVMSGVYYRVGAFKAKPVYTTDRKRIDGGMLVVTSKNLFFVGKRTSKKIPYSKIISFEQFSDGIGLMRDAASAKPQMFLTGDGWFTYNLITNLARL